MPRKLTDRQIKRFKKHLEKHVTPEVAKARKQTVKLRKAVQKGQSDTRSRRVTEDNWEELLDQHGVSRRRTSHADLAEALEEQQEILAEDVSEHEVGIVMGVASGRCRVFRDGRELDCSVPAELAVRQKSVLAVGDRVAVAEEGAEAFRVRAVLPRRSVLARPDPLHAHRQRLIAANVDVVVHVVTLRSPPLRPRLIDRFLIAIQRGGAQPLLCINKIDLLDARERSEELAKLEMYRELGVPVIAASSKTGEGIAELRAGVQGRIAALVGHSGVGKSSILNAIDESLQLATNTLQRRGTGRHTTSASTLYDFGDGTYLIDTPGIREFGLWDLDRETLRDYFPEFTEPSESCRFTNCSHVHEPDCEVKDRVESGELSEARYETYARLWEDLEK